MPAALGVLPASLSAAKRMAEGELLAAVSKKAAPGTVAAGSWTDATSWTNGMSATRVLSEGSGVQLNALNHVEEVVQPALIAS